MQFGVGAAFQSAGVPQIGAIAGPEYLLTVSPDGDLDKLDERLAARQIAWLADLARQLDGVPAAELGRATRRSASELRRAARRRRTSPAIDAVRSAGRERHGRHRVG